MSKEQPEALRLADAIERRDYELKLADVVAELRRLHAENEALRAQIGQGVPDGVLDALDNFEKKERSPFQAYLAAGLVNELRTALLASAPPAPQQKPLTDEQDRALCEAYCNAASDEYFKARPQLDSDVNRRIFYAGHRKAWIEWQAAHNIGEKK